MAASRYPAAMWAPCGQARDHDLILGQARTLYRMWPDVWQGELLL